MPRLTAPPKGSPPAERFLALSIAAGCRTLYLSNADVLPDDDFRRLLCAGWARGMDIRVFKATTKADIKSVYVASRAHYATLLGCGVRLHEFQATLLHAKTCDPAGTRPLAFGASRLSRVL